MVRLAATPNQQANDQVSVPDYLSWKTATSSFKSMGASIANQQDLGADHTGGYPEHLDGEAVTPSLFETLKVLPQLGRVFREEEAQIGMPAPVVVLSHRLWQRRFG